MIYEFRTYDILPRMVPEVEKRLAEGLAERTKLSPLAAFWHTEIGPLNQVVHVWPYENMEERNRIRAEAAKSPNWPPKTGEFLTRMESQIFMPFPNTACLEPGANGPIYELRSYQVKPGSVPMIIDNWSRALPARIALSPLAFVGFSDVGTLNTHLHIWAYKSLEHRAQVRSEAIEKGIWPPKASPGSEDLLVTQQNKILLPASFSPMQ